MILVDADIPDSCQSCLLNGSCDLWLNSGVIERRRLDLEDYRHPNCKLILGQVNQLAATILERNFTEYGRQKNKVS